MLFEKLSFYDGGHALVPPTYLLIVSRSSKVYISRARWDFYSDQLVRAVDVYKSRLHPGAYVDLLCNMLYNNPARNRMSARNILQVHKTEKHTTNLQRY